MRSFRRLWLLVFLTILVGCEAAPPGDDTRLGKARSADSVTAITDLVAVPGDNKVTFFWSEDAAATGWNLYGCEGAGCTPALNYGGTTQRTTFETTPNTNGLPYTFYMNALDGSNPEVGPGNQVNVSPAQCCTSIGGLTLTDASSGSSVYGSPVTFKLAFSAADNTADAPANYVDFAYGCTGTAESTCPNSFQNNVAITRTGVGTFTAQTTTSSLNVATYSGIRAFLHVATDTGGVSTNSATAPDHTVTQFLTSTSVVANTTPSVYGQGITFTATVPAQIPASGYLTFYDGTTPLGNAVTVPASSSTTSYTSDTLSSFTVGTHSSITAVYTSNSPTNVKGSTSAAASQEVDPAATSTTSFTASPNPSLVGNSVTFSATVSVTSPGGPPGGVAPTGKIHFVFGDTPTAADIDVTTSNGVTSATTTHAYTAASTGYVVTAKYLGDTNYNASAVAATASNEVVNKDGTTLSLSSAATSAVYGSNNTFTARVTTNTAGYGAPAMTDTVDFYATPTSGTAQPIATGCPLASASGSLNGYNWVEAISTSMSCTNVGVVTPVTQLPGLASGQSYTITAKFTAGDSSHAAAMDASYSPFAISTQQATITTSTTTASKFGQSVTLTAHVVSNGTGLNPPTGKVTFLDTTTGQTLGTPTIADSSTHNAAVTINSLTATTHAITATYNPAVSPATPDYNYSTNSAPITQVVNAAGTTTVSIQSSNPGVVGVPLTYTANVAAVTPGVDLGGNSISAGTATVTFKDGMTTIGTGTFTANETWTFSTSTLSVGDHTITAVYNGNSNFAASTSNTLSQHIDATGTPATITSSQNPSAFAASVTFTATLGATTGGVPTGTVTFQDASSSGGEVALGTATLNNGVATVTTSALAAGVHGIGFVYNGDTNHVAGANASLAQTVMLASTQTELSASPNPSLAGQAVSLTASVSSPTAGAIGGTVTFKDNGAVIATVALSSGLATTTTLDLGVGSHALSADYSGDGNFDVSSGTLGQTVDKPQTTLALSSSSNPSAPSSNVTFSAVVRPVAPATGVVTGSVTFTDGAQTLGTSALAGGIATFRSGTLSAGPHAIHAAFLATTDFAASDATITETISTDAASMQVTATPNPATFGATVTITASVSAQTGVPSGSIAFASDSGPLGSAPIDGQGNATVTTTTLPIGALTITATYSGDGFYPAGAGSVAEVVTKGATSVSLASSTNPAVTGANISFTATVAAAVSGFDGSVDFTENGTVLGSIALKGTTATFSTASLTAGAHSIIAVYKGNATFASSTSAPLTETVNVGSGGGTPDGNGDGGASSDVDVDAGGGDNLNLGVGNASSGSSSCASTPSSTSRSALAGLLVGAAALVLAMRRRRK